MRRFLLFIGIVLAVCCYNNILSSKEIPKLIFQKRWYPVIEHKIKEGEHLYSILRSYGFSNRIIPYIIKYIKKDNPHIKNINNLRPGTTLVIPKIHIKRYKVKPGDFLVKILKTKGNIPEHLIFNEYINLFKVLNPKIKNINILKSGVIVNLPFLGKEIFITKTPVKHKDINRVFKERHNLPEKLFLLLKIADFKIITGKKMILPKMDGSWTEVDTGVIPLAQTPWGEKFFLINKKILPVYISVLKKLRFPFYPIDTQKDFFYSFQKLFKELGLKYQKHLLFWNKNKSIIIFTDLITIELKSDIQFVVLLNNTKNYYFYFFKHIQLNENILYCLTKLFAKFNIHIYFLKNNIKDLTTFKNLFIPKITIEELIHKNIKQTNFVLPVLKEKNYLIKIYLQAPTIYKDNKLEGMIFTKDNMDFSLITLLNLKGFTCFLLKNNE